MTWSIIARDDASGAFGIAAANAVFDLRYDLHQARLADRLAAGSPAANDALGQWGAALSDPVVTEVPAAGAPHVLRMVAQLVEREATVLTINDLWQMLAVVTAAALPTVLFLTSGRGRRATTGAAG